MNPEHDPTWLQRLDEFAEQFRANFRRRDQARWAAVYLQGLLLPGGERKTIGTIGRRVVLPPDLVVEDISQALQNFVNQSPWDERPVSRRCREQLAECFADPDGSLVVDEIAVPKQGRHSVGVQRQFSSALGKKANCQVAVAVHFHGAAGICPLGLRLYLPRNWLSSPAQLDVAGVPDEFRQPQSKAAIALDLLDEVRAEGWRGRVVIASSFRGAESDFRAAIRERGLNYVGEASESDPTDSGEHFGQSPDGGLLLSSNQPVDETARRSWLGRDASRALGRTLLQEFGLEHFEGRSWRGFHHHACLVQMAFTFRAVRCGKPCPAVVTS